MTDVNGVEHFEEIPFGHGANERTVRDAYATSAAARLGREAGYQIADTFAQICARSRDEVSDICATKVCGLTIDGTADDAGKLSRAFFHCPNGTRQCGNFARLAAERAVASTQALLTDVEAAISKHTPAAE